MPLKSGRWAPRQDLALLVFMFLCEHAACRKLVWAAVFECCSMEQEGKYCPGQASTWASHPTSLFCPREIRSGTSQVHLTRNRNLYSERLTWMHNGARTLYRRKIKWENSYSTESLTNLYLGIDVLSNELMNLETIFSFLLTSPFSPILIWLFWTKTVWRVVALVFKRELEAMAKQTSRGLENKTMNVE